MRRLFVLLAGVGLMSTTTGCYCVCGKCDCAGSAVLHLRPVSAGVRHAGAAADAAGPTNDHSGRGRSARPDCGTDSAGAADEGTDRAAAGAVIQNEK